MTDTNDLLEHADVSGTIQQTALPEQPFDPKKFVPVERFNGLQGSVQKLSTENKDLKVKLQDISTERELLDAEYKDHKGYTEALIGNLKTEAEQNKNLATKTAHELEAMRKIILEYPELSSFYAKGLIRTEGLEGDKLTEFLTEYKQTLTGLQTQAKQEYGAGSTPAKPASTSSATASSSDLYSRLMQLSPSDPTYKEIQQQYFNLIREEQKKNG